MGKDSVRAQQPEDLTGLKISEPPKSAAGVSSLGRVLHHIQRNHAAIDATRTLLSLNQKQGIDCMSCAWPEPDGHRKTVEFCENGAKAVAWETDSRRITASFFERYSVAELSQRSEYWLGQQGRLTEPMLLDEGASHYKQISWDNAFALLADELNGLDSPDEAVFYTSGRTSNEAAFLYQLFVRHFGTNNLPDCSNMCHESSGSGLSESIGIGKGTVTLDDFTRAQVIVIIGQNAGTNHPRMLSTLKDAKEAGAKIVTINPLLEPGLIRFRDPQTFNGLVGSGTAISDLYLQVRINGDAALIKAVMKDLLDAGAIDHEFIRGKTHGFDTFSAALRTQNPEELAAQSGIPREQSRELAMLLGASERIIVCWAMGITQHRNGVAMVQEIVNLLLLRGSLGKPGAGVCPVRGHSNVQGDRTMGIWEKPGVAFLDQIEQVCGFNPPRHHGFDTVASIQAMHEGQAKVFVAMGGNFAAAAPDTEFTAEALRRTRLTVQVATKLNRSHLITGKRALLLPCLGRTEIDRQASGEQFVSTENSMGVVQTSRGRLQPASEFLRSEPSIVCGMAGAVLGTRSRIDWQSLADDYDNVRDLIAAVVPGCEDYNRKVRQPGGFYLPNKPRDGHFNATASGKAQFTVHSLPHHSIGADELVMTTIRSHDQFNTTIYGLDDVYRGIRSERRVVLMNAADIAARQLQSGALVDIVSRWQGTERVAHRFVVVPYDIPRGNCATYFPEANVLVPVGSVAEISNQPASKSVVVSISATRQAPV